MFGFLQYQIFQVCMVSELTWHWNVLFLMTSSPLSYLVIKQATENLCQGTKMIGNTTRARSAPAASTVSRSKSWPKAKAAALLRPGSDEFGVVQAVFCSWFGMSQLPTASGFRNGPILKGQLVYRFELALPFKKANITAGNWKSNGDVSFNSIDMGHSAFAKHCENTGMTKWIILCFWASNFEHMAFEEFCKGLSK